MNAFNFSLLSFKVYLNKFKNLVRGLLLFCMASTGQNSRVGSTLARVGFLLLTRVLSMLPGSIMHNDFLSFNKFDSCMSI
jgi:hypothetical protein